MGSLTSVFHKMTYSETPQMEFLTIDMDFGEIEKNLEQRRKFKLSFILLIFLISIGAIIYSVIHDMKRRHGGNVRHLEKLVCADTDEECLGQLCPLTMTYDRLKDRCQ